LLTEIGRTHGKETDNLHTKALELLENLILQFSHVKTVRQLLDSVQPSGLENIVKSMKKQYLDTT
jgi:hypothetical protein